MTRASAPGKVLWAGEYAVLEGAPAVVMAVERRARAVIGAEAQRLSPFLEAARLEVGDVMTRVRVDSSALRQAGRKLGLGSSAAATVAAVAAALGTTEGVHAIAHRAHARAQEARGARGSGADVAASVHGGLLEVRRDGELPTVRRLVLPEGLTPVLIWTGEPADTPSLVAHVRTLRDRDPQGHARAIHGLAEAARTLIAACDEGAAAAAVTAVRAGAEALADLAARAGATLVPPSFAAVAALAETHGGAAKPTGAGGGDLILCVFAGPAAAFRAAATTAGMILVSADVAREGVRLERDA